MLTSAKCILRELFEIGKGLLWRRRRSGPGVIEKGLAECRRCVWPEPGGANDPVLIDQVGERYDTYFEEVEGVHKNGPLHLLPLHEQSAAIRVLLLDNAEHLDLALLLQVASRLVPPGHVNSAARSPGGEDMQNRLGAAEVSHRLHLSIESPEGDLRERLADLDGWRFGSHRKRTANEGDPSKKQPSGHLVSGPGCGSVRRVPGDGSRGSTPCRR